MKSVSAPVPHHALVRAFAAQHLHNVALLTPGNAAQAGTPFGGVPAFSNPHPHAPLAAGRSVYAAPPLGMTHHHKTRTAPHGPVYGHVLHQHGSALVELPSFVPNVGPVISSNLINPHTPAPGVLSHNVSQNVAAMPVKSGVPSPSYSPVGGPYDARNAVAPNPVVNTTPVYWSGGMTGTPGV